MYVSELLDITMMKVTHYCFYYVAKPQFAVFDRLSDPNKRDLKIVINTFYATPKVSKQG